MKLSLRFILPLLLCLGLFAYAVVPLAETFVRRWFLRDIELRSELIHRSIHENIALSAISGKKDLIASLFARVTQDERVLAMAFCPASPDMRSVVTGQIPREFSCDAPLTEAASEAAKLNVRSFSITSGEKEIGRLVLFHDLSFIERRKNDLRRYLFYALLALGIVISGLTAFIAQLSWRGFSNAVRSILSGEALLGATRKASSPEFRGIERDLRKLIAQLDQSRKEKDEARISWTPKAIKDLLHHELAGQEVFVVSNREPCIHVRKGDVIESRFPASGLVTALEPVMRACGGTWIAHGSGSADREVVDAHDRVGIPQVNPDYFLRRVWLTEEEEQGYYYGFSNEGLWPLCHIAHVRPTFRTRDFELYRQVNQKFCDAVVREANSESPIILVQDYHFALLPRMIRERLPKAVVIAFWHIPWPNPESFGICPWREEILRGLLGSTILGFHTQFHCNNFIDTVDRFLESRIDRELSRVIHHQHATTIAPYPISIEWPPRWIPDGDGEVSRKEVLGRYGIPLDARVGLGVDRLDYTKGILERFRAVERLLELRPQWVGKFSFLQIAAPSRSSIETYASFSAEVTREAERINARFTGDGQVVPIRLVIEHHEPEEVYRLYRVADLCFVSSLHDGMNLVAKEFVAARSDERGVLILSSFTGASRELPEALIVNPYDSDQCARALSEALLMPLHEQKQRMQSMRGLVQEFNVFRWAGRMLLDAARVVRRESLQQGIGAWKENARADALER